MSHAFHLWGRGVGIFWLSMFLLFAFDCYVALFERTLELAQILWNLVVNFSILASIYSLSLSLSLSSLIACILHLLITIICSTISIFSFYTFFYLNCKFLFIFLAKNTFWSLHFQSIPVLVPKFFFYRF